MDIGGATGAGTSLALGGFGRGVHPLDQAAAYAAFAARGVAAAPYLVEKVTNPEGRTLYQAAPTATPKFDRAVVDDATFAMQSVVDDGTATNAQLAGGRPAAGKTGTTSGNTAAWFCGYTPQLAAVSVLFRDGNAPLQGIAGVSEVTGGTLPASIWKTFMDQALQGQPVRRFASPAYVGSTRYAGPSPSVTSSATARATPSPASTRSPTARPAPSRSAGASPLATPSGTRSVPPSSLPPSSSGSAAPSAGASTPPSAAAAAAQSPAFAPKSTNPLADGSG
jgi:membrane peptidoglycan carboxypeptidase